LARIHETRGESGLAALAAIEGIRRAEMGGEELAEFPVVTGQYAHVQVVVPRDEAPVPHGPQECARIYPPSDAKSGTDGVELHEKIQKP